MVVWTIFLHSLSTSTQNCLINCATSTLLTQRTYYPPRYTLEALFVLRRVISQPSRSLSFSYWIFGVKIQSFALLCPLDHSEASKRRGECLTALTSPSCLRNRCRPAPPACTCREPRPLRAGWPARALGPAPLPPPLSLRERAISRLLPATRPPQGRLANVESLGFGGMLSKLSNSEGLCAQPLPHDTLAVSDTSRALLSGSSRACPVPELNSFLSNETWTRLGTNWRKT